MHVNILLEVSHACPHTFLYAVMSQSCVSSFPLVIVIYSSNWRKQLLLLPVCAGILGTPYLSCNGPFSHFACHVDVLGFGHQDLTETSITLRQKSPWPLKQENYACSSGSLVSWAPAGRHTLARGLVCIPPQLHVHWRLEVGHGGVFTPKEQANAMNQGLGRNYFSELVCQHSADSHFKHRRAVRLGVSRETTQASSDGGRSVWWVPRGV